MFNFWNRKPPISSNNGITQLFDQETFYCQFVKDLRLAESEVIIESPFISRYRMNALFPVFKELIDRNVRVFVVTRDPKEHIPEYAWQSEDVIRRFEVLGVAVLLWPKNHHRKLAIIDRDVLWEGSLNILSQTKSQEIMRRFEGGNYACEMIDFLKLERHLPILD